jgi:hypothetical protein
MTGYKNRNLCHALFFLIVFMTVVSCSSPIKMTSSWTSEDPRVIKSPVIMVMVMGSNPDNRKAVERYITDKLTKKGHKAIASLDVFKPDVQKYDSASMVRLLKENKIDMLLTNMVVHITQIEKYVPGTTELVSGGAYPTAYSPYYPPGTYYGGFNNFYGYYNYYGYNYLYEEKKTKASIEMDVELIIESKLYDVDKVKLIYIGQSKSITGEPSAELFNIFANVVVKDIEKKNLILK